MSIKVDVETIESTPHHQHFVIQPGRYRLTMGPTTVCKCRSHCSKYNPVTGKYEGSSTIPKSTAANHRKDDQTRSVYLGNLDVQLTSRVLDGLPLQSFAREVAHPHTNPTIRSQAPILVQIETEVMDRIYYTMTGDSLVFIHQDFLASGALLPQNQVIIGNRGTCALDPNNQANIRFLSNETRFLELLHLAQQHEGDDEAKEQLEGRIT